MDISNKISITKENYEEFFLLYIDNELPVSERLRVEQFVAENPDLKEEWEALLQCRIQPEQGLTFRDKGGLLHYEPEFLSYIDGELTREEREAVEAVVRQYPSRALQLQQLQMTVSHPDPDVTFPDKESLYRKENTGRVVFWLRMGAAAAVLFAVALLLLPRSHDSTTVPSIAVNKKSSSTTVTPSTPSALHSTGDDHQTAQTAGTPPSQEATAGAKTRVTLPSVRLAPRTGTARPGIDSVSRHSNAPVDLVEVPPAKVTDSDLSAVDPVRRTEKASVDAPPIAATTGKDLTPADPATAVVIPREESSFATQALLQEAQGDGSDNLTAAPASPGKGKLRGLLRKVTRVFESTADRDNEGQKEVLISAFQVAVK